MIIEMDMATGKYENLSNAEEATEEFGEFVEEVLNAGWLPQPEAQLAVHEHVAKKPEVPVDAEAFLNALYRNQE